MVSTSGVRDTEMGWAVWSTRVLACAQDNPFCVCDEDGATASASLIGRPAMLLIDEAASAMREWRFVRGQSSQGGQFVSMMAHPILRFNVT